MSESTAQEQRRTKPAFENIIVSRGNMSDEEKQAAFAFLDYCNTKNITYKWSSTNRWNLNVKGKSLGYIGIGVRSRDDDSWSIILHLNEFVQYEDFIQKEGLTEIIHNNIHYCESCNQNRCCKDATILGKAFHNLCGFSARFKNPNDDGIKSIQSILDFWLAIPQGTASRPLLDPATDGFTRINNKLHVVGVSDLEGNANENMDNLFSCKFSPRTHGLKYYYVGWMYPEFNTNKSIHDIVFELDKPVELKMYGLVTGLRLDVPDRWALYGAESKDGAWTLLDTRDAFPKPVTLYTEKAFTIESPKTYQRYRIAFEGTHFVMSQIHLHVERQNTDS